MDLYDWLLFLHLLSAFALAAAMVVHWAVVFATRSATPSLGRDDAARVAAIIGPMAGIGAIGVLIFGLWLSIEVDEYNPWDPWILASVVLWLVANIAGARSGKLFALEGADNRRQSVMLHVLSTVILVVILALMIWKPGA